MRFFIYLSYRGTSYFGWPSQPNQPSVQERLENALSLYTGNPVSVTGAGRTDTGVHALDYVAHFDTEFSLLAENSMKHIYKLNAILPSDIVINDIRRVKDSSHARFDAISRTYKYFIHMNQNPFCNEYSYYFHYKINIDNMNEACKYIIGKHDFTSMAKLHTDVKTNICNVTNAKWELTQENTICFTITADRFLRNMVRAIVGSLLEVGRGKKDIDWIKEILEAKDRGKAGNSVPAKALFLYKIEYPQNYLEI